MISQQFKIDLNDELILDDFAGGGGASIGMEMATGRHVDYACNHNASALGMHHVNHPQTTHHLADVFKIDPNDPRFRRRTGIHWFSPDCTHFSKAKGGKPVNKKIRGLAFVILKWAKHGDRCIYMENVEEIQTWGPLLKTGKPDPRHKGRTWRAFLAALGAGVPADSPDIEEMLEVVGDFVSRADLIQGFGYEVQTREIRACDFGAPTIRKRLYLIARNDGRPIQWPRPTHAAPENARKLGLKPYNIVADCIDWHLPCYSIFLTKRLARQYKCKRPLARATRRRIAAGVDRYMLKAKKPYFVRTGPGFLTEHANASNQRNVPLDKPAPTICAEVKGGHFALVSGVLVNSSNSKTTGRGPNTWPATEPLRTITSAPGYNVATASMVRLNGDPETHAPGSTVTEPAGNICAGGQHHAVSIAYLAQHNGGFNTNPGHPADAPASTINSSGSHQQVVTATLGALNCYYGSESDGQGLDESLRTISSKPRFGLTQAEAIAPLMGPEHIGGALRVAKFLRAHGVKFEGEFAMVGNLIIIDLRMRMLTPRELFRAQGFPESYVIDKAIVFNPEKRQFETKALSKSEQIRMCGNSVSPPVAAALIRANNPEMCVWLNTDRKDFKRMERKAVESRKVFAS